MSTFDEKIKDIANKEFQHSTGVPPEMLRGMAAKAEQQAAAFASRRLAQAVKEDKPDLTIKSTISNLGKGHSVAPVEGVVGGVGGGGTDALGPVSLVIMNDNGTLNYYNVNMEFTGAV